MSTFSVQESAGIRRGGCNLLEAAQDRDDCSSRAVGLGRGGRWAAATHEIQVLLMKVLGSSSRTWGPGFFPSLSGTPLYHWDPFVVLIVQEGLLPWELRLVGG